ncbi:MAG TPA: antitoxin [Actinophytocola sp.]|uniref:antitoxin n=1 Tax=Actinophytocola sp. TaxID=1872138 RepID=UPI002DBADAE3|nr:antitoxin [Actinophytocola sp.]HEU5475348.1 antitoxin [Actinophytocola sp.]
MAKLLRKLTVVAGAAGAARQYVKKNPDKVNRVAEQAGRFINKRTKGKYHGKVDDAIRKVQTATDKVARS